jgi:hypothetical protein
MSETIATQTFATINTQEFAPLAPKARLERFSWEYCRALAAASKPDLDAEARALGVPVEQVETLAGLVNETKMRIVAEVMRIFGDREPPPGPPTALDTLMDDIMGISGREGTIPG